MWFRRAAVMSLVALSVISIGSAPAAAGGGCFHGVPPSDGTGDTVEMTANCFEATVLRVDADARVTWLNRDPYAHTVTGVGGTWGDFSEIARGESVSYRFATDGIYLYSCMIHPGMVGAVVVGDGKGDAGLAPAALVSSPAASSAPAATAARAPSGGISWIWSALLAAALGIGLGFAFSRRRRSETTVARV